MEFLYFWSNSTPIQNICDIYIFFHFTFHELIPIFQHHNLILVSKIITYPFRQFINPFKMHSPANSRNSRMSMSPSPRPSPRPSPSPRGLRHPPPRDNSFQMLDEMASSSSSLDKDSNCENPDTKEFWVKKYMELIAAKNAADLKVEQLKQRNTELELENKQIRQSKVHMQVRVEQEEEYISNMLLKRIQKLKTDKELLAQKYEQEEEFLANDLMRKLTQLEGERDELASRLEKGQQCQIVASLMLKIRKLEAKIQSNHKSLDQLRREKVDLENSLEHEQESLFNTLGKRMDSLEAEKRRLQCRLDEFEQQKSTSSATSGAGRNPMATGSETGGQPLSNATSSNSAVPLFLPSEKPKEAQ